LENVLLVKSEVNAGTSLEFKIPYDVPIEELDASPKGSPSFQKEKQLELEATNLGGGLADVSIENQKEMTESTATGDTPATTKDSAGISPEE